MAPFPKTPTFVERISDGIITRVALQLCAQKGDHYDPAGTATVVGPWLAVTAKHVVLDYAEQFEESPLRNGGTGSFSLIAIEVAGEDKIGFACSVSKFALHETSDIALLELQPWTEVPANFEWKCPRLRLAPPAIGERVVSFGYFGTEVSLTEDEAIVSRRMATSVGEVTDVYLTGRDSLLSWSSFATNARYDGGMSGGPVFTDGSLSGLICRNMPPHDGEEHYSTVTCLWPLMGLEIDFDLPNRPRPGKYYVIELLERGGIVAVDADRVSLKRVGDRVQVGLRVARSQLPSE
jgi:hypothetical protein